MGRVGFPLAVGGLLLTPAGPNDTLLALAVRLRRPPLAAAGRGDATGARVVATARLNPRGLIFGRVLLPPAGAPGAEARLLAFVLPIVGVAAPWAAAGAARGRNGAGAPPLLLRRAAARRLGVVAAGLLAGLAGA